MKYVEHFLIIVLISQCPLLSCGGITPTPATCCPLVRPEATVFIATGPMPAVADAVIVPRRGVALARPWKPPAGCLIAAKAASPERAAVPLRMMMVPTFFVAVPLGTAPPSRRHLHLISGLTLRWVMAVREGADKMLFLVNRPSAPLELTCHSSGGARMLEADLGMGRLVTKGWGDAPVHVGGRKRGSRGSVTPLRRCAKVVSNMHRAATRSNRRQMEISLPKVKLSYRHTFICE